MQKLKIYVAGSTDAAFGYGDETSNYGAIVTDAFVRTIRDTVVINTNARRFLQNRPQRSYDGAAEHMFLVPAAKLAMSATDPITYLMQAAKHGSTIAKAVAALGTKMTVSSFAQIISDIIPSTTIPGQYDIIGTGVGYPAFLKFINELTTNYVARQNIYKTMTSPGFNFQPPTWKTAPVTAQVINDQLMAMQRFGIIGQRIPLLGLDSDPLSAARFMCEAYMFSVPNSDQASDQKLAFAALYTTYDAIAKSEASYDAAFPVVPPTANDQALPASYMNMLAHFVKTCLQCATLPTLIDIRIKHKMYSDAIEFIETGPHYAPEIVEKCKKTLAAIADHLSAMSFGPDSAIASSMIEYLKGLTGARYLLPDMFRGFKNSAGDFPFRPLPLPATIDLPANYPGYQRAAQIVTEFSGMDVPRLISNIYDRLQDLKAGMIDFRSEQHGLESSFTVGMGVPFSNLAHLTSFNIADAPLGEFKYTKPTEVSLIPTYVSKYVKNATTSQLEWILAGKKYKPFFPLAFHYNQVILNCRKMEFAWDSDVSLPSTPSTGSDLAKLLVPHNYLTMSLSNTIPNEIGPVGSQLAALPHRPMAAITDWFTPVFQDLATLMVREDVVANALLGMFTLYKRRGDGPYSSVKHTSFQDWVLVDPQIPFIYGYPKKAFCDANAPWSQSFPCTLDHIKISADGQFMLVLHRAIPTPTTVKYIPYTLRGGLRISLPVNAGVLNRVMDMDSSTTYDSPQAYYSAVLARLLAYTPTNGLVAITAWGKAFQFFPHIFFSNKFDQRAATHFTTQHSAMFSRHRIAKDDMQYFGYNLQYFNLSVVVMEPNDEVEAYENPSLTLDIAEENKGKYAATAKPSGAPPAPQNIEVTDDSVTHEEEVATTASTASDTDIANNPSIKVGQSVAGKSSPMSATSSSLKIPGDMAPPDPSEVAEKLAKEAEEVKKSEKKK